MELDLGLVNLMLQVISKRFMYVIYPGRPYWTGWGLLKGREKQLCRRENNRDHKHFLSIPLEKIVLDFWNK